MKRIRFLNLFKGQNKFLFKQTGLVLILLGWANLSFVNAQSLTVTGKVTDKSNNDFLPGVNILIEGSSKGTATDMNGNFTIEVPNTASVLVFSYTGYQTIKIPVNGQIKLDVSLQPDVKTLDEIVVVGYGTQRRADITGSVSSVSAKDLKDIPLTSTAEAITGKLAGVQITTTDGSPDADVMIRVRGGGSVTQDNSPLYIVDGFPVSKIDDIAPSDIATIDVLKDASSTAIYGARGSNGVLIITTKTPKAGKTTVSYNGYLQVKTLPKELSVLSPYEFVLLQYELASLKGTTNVSAVEKYFGVFDDIDIYKNQKGTDWQKEMFGKTTYSQSHNFSIMGGNESTKYNVSLTRTEDPGIMVNSGYKRTNINFRLTHQLIPQLNLELNTRFSDMEVNGQGTSATNSFSGQTSSTKVRNAVIYRPTNGLSDYIPEDESQAELLDNTSGLVDPVTLSGESYEKQKRYSSTMSAAGSWTITPGLVFRSEFGVDYNYNTDNIFWGPDTYYSQNYGSSLPLIQMNSSQNPGYRLANTISYQVKGLGEKHNLNLMAGQEILSERTVKVSNGFEEFPSDISPEKAFAMVNLGSSDISLTGTTTTPYERLASFFGRANYSLKKRYLLSASFRADGSSKFAPGKQWGYFPAASAGWRVSEEEFMRDFTFVSDLKLRASYGEAGNNRINDDLWRTTYSLSTTKAYGFGDVADPYYVVSSSLLTNPNLKWETTLTRNIGIDFGILKNRISGTMDAYWNTTMDLLVKSTVPSYTGYSYQMRNIGQTSNRGLEFSLNGTIIDSKDFKLMATFNIGMNRSRVDKLDGVESQYGYSNWASTNLRETSDFLLKVGQPVGLIYGYVSDGMYTTDDFDYNSTTKTYTIKDGVEDDENIISAVNFGPGCMKLKKLVKNDSATISSSTDRKIIGNTNPLSTGGFNITATYKGLDLSLFFNWVYGNKIYNANKIDFTTYYNRTYTNYLSTVDYAHRYKYMDLSGTVVTDPTALTELNKNATMWSPLMGRPVISSWAVEDGSFLRLNNITFGYSLPKPLISRFHMEQFRLYCSVHNAWIWTNYTGYDPEVNSIRGSSTNPSPLTPGVDFSAYPKSRSYTFGVNVTF
jgi:TonB-dependent starch-binding outer membrane protein SusC